VGGKLLGFLMSTLYEGEKKTIARLDFLEE